MCTYKTCPICKRSSDNETCTWKEDENLCWKTECENMFIVNDGFPSENGMKYCPYCGKKLVEKRFNDE